MTDLKPFEEELQGLAQAWEDHWKAHKDDLAFKGCAMQLKDVLHRMKSQPPAPALVEEKAREVLAKYFRDRRIIVSDPMMEDFVQVYLAGYREGSGEGEKEDANSRI